MKKALLLLLIGITPLLPVWAQTLQLSPQNASEIQMLGVLPLQTQNLRGLIVMEDSLLFSGNYDGEKIVRFDLASQSETILWESERRMAEHPSLNMDETQLAFITNEEVQILDLATGESDDFFVPEEDEDVPNNLAFNATQIAITTVDGRILILDAASGDVLQEISSEEGAEPTQIKWLNENQLLSGHMDGTLHLGDTIWEGHSRRVSALATGGDLIASTGADHQVKVWNVSDQTELYSFEAVVSSLAFSPDGSLLIGGGASLHIWDLASGEKVYEGFHSSPQINAQNAAFSPDGSVIVSGRQRIGFWGLSAGDLTLDQIEDDRLAAGAELYQRNACYGCHFDYPSGAPTLYGLGELAGDRVEGMSAEDFIYESIVDPDAYIPRGYPRGIHPGYFGERMSSEQIWLLVEYIMSLEPRR